MKDKLKELLEKLKEKYPKEEVIRIQYNGSGDSLDSMFVASGDIKEKDLEELFQFLIDESNEDCKNEGHEVEIEINLKDMIIHVRHYCMVYIRDLCCHYRYDFSK